MRTHICNLPSSTQVVFSPSKSGDRFLKSHKRVCRVLGTVWNSAPLHLVALRAVLPATKQERFDEAALSTSRIPVQDLLPSMSENMEGVDVPLGPAVPETVELTNEYFPHLSSHEWSALERMRDVIGEAAVISLLRSAPPEGQKNAAVSFMHHEIIESRKHVATPVSSFRTVPLKLDVSPYRGGENEPLSRWFVELDASITARQLRDPLQRVLFAMSNLAGRAKSWAVRGYPRQPQT
ncbi:hypothetical protein FI667_g11381, partial [Globisporangium splendens]